MKYDKSTASKFKFTFYLSPDTPTIQLRSWALHKDCWQLAGNVIHLWHSIMTLINNKYTKAVFRHDLWVKTLENWLQSLPAVCLSLMHNTAGGSLHTHQQQILCIIQALVQLGAAGRGRKRRINSTAEITWFSLHLTDTGVSSYHHKLSLHIIVYVYGAAVSPEDFCLFFHFCACRVLAHPPLTCCGTRRESLLCYHINFSWISTDFTLGVQAQNIHWNCGASH